MPGVVPAEYSGGRKYGTDTGALQQADWNDTVSQLFVAAGLRHCRAADTAGAGAALKRRHSVRQPAGTSFI